MQYLYISLDLKYQCARERTSIMAVAETVICQHAKKQLNVFPNQRFIQKIIDTLFLTEAQTEKSINQLRNVLILYSVIIKMKMIFHQCVPAGFLMYAHCQEYQAENCISHLARFVLI